MKKILKRIGLVVSSVFLVGAIYAPVASAATPTVDRKAGAVVVVDRKASTDLAIERKTGVDRKTGTTEKER